MRDRQHEMTAGCHGPELWSTKRTAKALGISERALWSLSFPRGRLPVCRLGRAVRYRPRDVESYIESQMAGATSLATGRREGDE